MFDVFTYFVYLSLLFTLLFVLKVSSNLRGNALYIEKINKLNRVKYDRNIDEQARRCRNAL